MKVFYEIAENRLETSEKFASEQSVAVARKQAYIELADESSWQPVHYHGKNGLTRFRHFVYKHPFVASFGSLASVALVATGLIYGTMDILTDTNPSYPHLNTSSSRIEIYNKNDKLLWGIPSLTLSSLSHSAYEMDRRKVFVTDLDGDDKNEVITTLPVGKQTMLYAPITCFSPEGEILRVIPFTEQIRFQNTVYVDRLGGQDILGIDIKWGQKEIFTVANGGRSPNIIYRYSTDWKVLGQYFHFGYGHLTPLNIEGSNKIAFFGQNDAGEPDSLSFPVLIILDPLKITGKSEASDSRGFGLPVSPAELFIIRFPLTDLNYLLKSNSTVSKITKTLSGDETTFIVNTMGYFHYNGADNHPAFDYMFSDKFEILDVKLNSQTLVLSKQLASEGKIAGAIDNKYLEDLKNQIRYWDGEKWQGEWAEVKH